MKNLENAWVMTRDRNPSVAVMQRAYGVLDKYKISRTFFLKTDQKDCARGGIYEQIAATSPTTEQPYPDEDDDDDLGEGKKIRKQLNISPVAEHILKTANEDKQNEDQREKKIKVVVNNDKQK